VAAQLVEYTVPEHRLLAKVERRAGTIPPGVRPIIERKRGGATYDELVNLTDDLLKGDLLARAAVLEWLDEELGPKAPPRPAADRPIVRPLSK
jgi:hypothetical protein